MRGETRGQWEKQRENSSHNTCLARKQPGARQLERAFLGNPACKRSARPAKQSCVCELRSCGMAEEGGEDEEARAVAILTRT